jgi:hypothetical protein
MESLVYHINRSDLNSSRWEEIRTAISEKIHGEYFKIVVEQETIEVHSNQALPQQTVSDFEKKIFAAKQDTISFVFKDNEFEQFAEDVMQGKVVDTERFKRVQL